MSIIYHIAMAADWKRALAVGEYTTSTRGRTLAEQGFIHASTARQVAGVANSFYQGAPDLLVLVIDTDKLTAPLAYIYGPLSPGAVIGTLSFEPGPDGTFTFERG